MINTIGLATVWVKDIEESKTFYQEDMRSSRARSTPV